MKDVVYFSKVEYKEVTGYDNVSSIMLLNIPERELSYQVYDWKRKMPAPKDIQIEHWTGYTWTSDTVVSSKKVRNEKTGTKSQLIKFTQSEPEVAFSYAIKMTDEQMKDLLPYCNALDFEPYRNREMKMGEEGYIGYRDEVKLYFRGITDSYIPLLELPMNYYYDKKHIWPSERLYRYLVQTFFEDNINLRGWGPTYGSLSLFV